MSQSPRIINVQQNIAVKAAPKKPGGGGGPKYDPDKDPTVKAAPYVVLGGLGIIILIILVSFINCKELLFFRIDSTSFLSTVR